MAGPQTILVNYYNITLYRDYTGEGVKISSVHYTADFGKERGPIGPRAGVGLSGKV